VFVGGSNRDGRKPLATTYPGYRGWILHTEHVKPEVVRRFWVRAALGLQRNFRSERKAEAVAGPS